MNHNSLWMNASREFQLRGEAFGIFQGSNGDLIFLLTLQIKGRVISLIRVFPPSTSLSHWPAIDEIVR